MDELGILENAEETATIVRNFATIGAVYADGVSLIFDGEDAPTEKHYLCNTSAFFSAGDRVKILPDSGTYVVEYVVGSPKQEKTVGLPSGGLAGQILQKMSDEEFHAAWQTLQGLLPTGGSAGQFLKKSSATNYAVTWGDMDEVSGTLPKGGSAGQFLVKSSVTDYAAGWQTAYTVPSGGSAGQILTKDSATAGDVSWQDAPQSSRAVGVQNQYSSTTQGSNSYRIQFRTNGTYGTGANTFQIRLGTGSWFTLATT